MRRRTRVLAVLVALVQILAVLGAGAGTGAAGATDTQSLWVDVAPETVTHGDEQQTMGVLVEGLDAASTFTVNVTPLSAAGVDLSAASVRAVDTDGLDANATLERIDGSDSVRVELAPPADATTTQYTFRLVLDGIDTTDAAHTHLTYTVEYTGDTAGTRRFELKDPQLPWVSTLTDADRLVRGHEDASQTVRVNFDAFPAVETATITVDLEPLAAQNVSLADATVTLRDVSEPVDVRRVSLNGSTVELRVSAAERVDPTFELVVSRLDTRGATPADPLYYEVTAVMPAGTVSGSTEGFGLYAPDDTPTPTPPPTTFPTTTPPPTDATSPADPGETPPSTQSPTPFPGTQVDGNDEASVEIPGFGVIGVLAALASAVLLGRRRE
jgi:PGF-CTERM protein